MEDQLKTRRRKEKRPREDVVTPSISNAGERVGLNEEQVRRSGFLSSSVVARDHIQKMRAEEDRAWMADKHHEEMFELAFYNAYKATLLTAEATARAYWMVRHSKREHERCLRLEESTSTMEGRIKKAEDERTAAETKQGLAKAAQAFSMNRVADLEGQLELSNGRIDELNHMVAQFEASRPQVEKDAVQAFLQTDEFKQMVKMDAAEAYMIGFEKCLKVLRKHYPDLDQSVLSAMELSSYEEEEEEEPAGRPEPLRVVPPSPHDSPKEA